MFILYAVVFTSVQFDLYKYTLRHLNKTSRRMAIVLGSLYLLLIVVVVVGPSKVEDNNDFRLQTSGSGSEGDQ